MAEIFGTPDPDLLNGTSGDDLITGEDGNDTIDGMEGNDLVAAVGSMVLMTGGAGDDTFVDTNGTADTYDGAGGTDTIDYRFHASNVFVYLNSFGNGQGHYGDVLISIENVITGSGNDTVWGTAGTNRIETGAGDDLLLSNGGGDTLIGGAGNDVYYGARADDLIIEAANEGIDLVRASAGVYTLPDNVENLLSEFEGGVIFAGNALGNEITGINYNDRLYGAGGNDILDGGGGYDELYGGLGDDIYLLRPGYDDTDLIVENANEGIDEVRTYLTSFTLPANVENLSVLIATTATVTYTGNELANSISGALGNDVLSGLGGDDMLFGGSGNDTLYGGDGNDFLDGGTGSDWLYGGAGDDVLRVGPLSSNAVMDGGDGFDTVLTNVAISQTTQLASIERFEFISDIVDLTLTSQQVTTGLANNVNFLGSTGLGRIVVNLASPAVLSAANFTFTGNIAYFRVNGSTGDDVITGPVGFASQLNGNGGADTIYGGAQDDTITGGTGADTLYGGGGSDRMNAETGDALVDGGAGFDTLAYSSSGTVTGTLANLEYFLVLGGPSISLSAAQLVAGFGSSGTFAGTGAITINLDPAASVLSLSGYTVNPGSAGTMTVAVNGSTANDQIKGLTGSVNTINGGDGNDQIRGGIFTDTIGGGAGNDKIYGAGGPDILTGGTGADQFRYLFQTDSGLGAAADRITDFASGSDRLNFALLDTNAGLAGVQGFAFVGNAAFSGGGAASIRYANSGADLLVQADINGDGIADMEIILQGLNGGTLTAADFIL
jgi:Ca2+-binding RTX toxin-like protein